MSNTITFYKGNRIDGEFSAAIRDVAQKFWASLYGKNYTGDGRLELSLRLFLTDPHGFNATWTDEEAFDRLYREVRQGWPHG